MTTKKLLYILVSLTILPFLVFTLVAGSYLFYVVNETKRSERENINRVYEQALLNDARSALSMGDIETFRLNINDLVEHSGDDMVSIELMDKNRTILASAPDMPDLTLPAIRIPVLLMTHGEENTLSERFDKKEEAQYIEGGYIILRYNNNSFNEATRYVVYLFIVLTLVLFVVIAGVYWSLKAKILPPIARISRRLETVVSGTANVEIVNNDYLSSLDKTINTIIKKLNQHEAAFETLTQQLVESRSHVDDISLEKAESLTVLVDKLSGPISESVTILGQLMLEQLTDPVRSTVLVALARVQHCNKTIQAAKLLLDCIVIEVIEAPVKVCDFQAGFDDCARHAISTVHISHVCDKKKLNDEIVISQSHVFKLVSKILSLADVTGKSRPEIFMHVRIEFPTSHSTTISIDIKDSGHGLSADQVRDFNLFMAGELDTYFIPGYPDDALRKIRFLSSRGKAMVSMSSEYGRGNHYQILIDHEVPVKDLLGKNNMAIIKGCVLHNDIQDNHMVALYREAGIHLRLIHQQDAKNYIGEIRDMDFVIVEFTADDNLSLSLCKILSMLRPDLVLIPTYPNNNKDRTAIADALFEMNIFGKALYKPYGPKSILDLIRDRRDNKKDVAAIINKFSDN